MAKFSAIPDEAKRADYNSNDHVGTVTALRSMGNWSGGLANTEHSICDAYCSLIKNSKSHVYMENQFFCTTVSTGESTRGNMDVENRIGEEICNRIIKAHENGEDFKMYCVIPLLPEGAGDIFQMRDGFATTRTIMHYQYAGFRSDPPKKECADFADLENRVTGSTIFTKLVSKGINPDDYIYFGGLRKYEILPNKQFQTEVIYVHSKLLIVDDKYTVIGSANCNDRSQLGDRDSEVCLLFESEDYATTLRHQLWSTFLGIDKLQVAEHNPTSLEMWIKFKNTAKSNTEVFDKVFMKPPMNKLNSYEVLETFRAEYDANQESLNDKANFDGTKVELEKISGVLVDYPLDFLKDEWFPPSTLPVTAPESLAPPKTFV